MKKTILALIISLFAVTNSMGNSLKLEVIGASSASNLYLSYLSIGVLADSYTKQIYDNRKTITFVNSITVQAKLQKDYLKKLIDGKEVPENDQAVVNKMIKCYGLLMDEGNYLKDYVNTGSKDSLASYDNKRKEAWALISDILGLKSKNK